jgi:putative tryptophan/tyrosine transport system substrate-binding protein
MNGPRRRFLLAAGALLAAPIVGAQPAGKVYRIGWLTQNKQSPASAYLNEALKEGLRELGYAEGRSYVIEYRSADGKMDRLDAAAAELVGSKVDVIVTNVNATTHAARRATKSIPIVMTVGTDVVAEGFAASLARPGGNITGLTWDVGVDVMAKRFEFLKEAVPKLARVAVLWDPGQDAPGFKRAIEEGGKAAGVKLIWLEVADDLEPAFAKAAREGAQALFTGGGNRMFAARKRVVELAARHKLPDAHYDSAFVDEGGMMSYAPNLPALFRGAAKYIDRILRGAKPGDLPVEQPMRIDLVINLKTAKTLGLNLPQSLLLRADRVIE